MKKFIIGSFIIFATFFMSNIKVDAVAQEYAGYAIANYALDLYESNKTEFKYTNDTNMIIDSYNNIKSYQENGIYYYGANNLSFVSMVLHYSTGLGNKKATTIGETNFIERAVVGWDVRASSEGIIETRYENMAIYGLFNDYTIGLRPGDILASVYENNSEVQIYVGNNSIIRFTEKGIEKIKGYKNYGNQKGMWYVYRISSPAAATLDLTNDYNAKNSRSIKIAVDSSTFRELGSGPCTEKMSKKAQKSMNTFFVIFRIIVPIALVIYIFYELRSNDPLKDIDNLRAQRNIARIITAVLIAILLEFLPFIIEGILRMNLIIGTCD